jgi:hypothetical protein
MVHRVPASYQMPGQQDWTALTVSGRKQELFAQDLYFRECWADMTDILGAATLSQLSSVALLTFKCDGVIGRRTRPTLQILEDSGFQAVAVCEFRHNRQAMRELWRYDWHVYPADRLNLMTLMHEATSTLLLLLADTRYDQVVPASARLADLKGPSDPAKLKPTHLRAMLSPPNRVINFIHVADEPVDVVREMGILLDRDLRRAALTLLRDGGRASVMGEVLRLATKLEDVYPPNDFDLKQALYRIESAGVAAADMAEVREAVSEGPALGWGRLTSIVDPRSPDIDLWDFIRVATDALPAERESCGGLVPAITSADWVARAAR